MAKSTLVYYYCGISACLNVILLIIIFRQPSVLFRSPVTSRIVSQSAIRTTKESLYVVYGEGNYSDDNDQQMMNYIRSMTSRPGPGGRHLKSENPTMHYSQVGGSQFVDDLLKQRRNGFLSSVERIPEKNSRTRCFSKRKGTGQGS